MQRLALLAVPFLALSPTLGCSASVSGEVDGEAVATLLSAFFVEDEDDTIDPDGDEATITFVGAQALSVLDGCNQAAKAQLNTNELLDTQLNDIKDAQEDGDLDAVKDAQQAFVDGVVEYEVANFPTDYWTVSIGAAALDADDIAGGDAEIKFDEAPDGDVIGFMSICRINDHPQTDEDDNDTPIIERDADCWSAVEADLEFVKFESQTAFEAKATATVYDPEDFDPIDDDKPKELGDVEIAISASFCQPLQDALDEQEEIIEDAADG